MRPPLSRATSTRLFALPQAVFLLTSVVVPSVVLAQPGAGPAVGGLGDAVVRRTRV